MSTTGSRSRVLTWGWIAIGGGLVLGLVGGFLVYQAHLRNAIVSQVIDSPWPGYVLVVMGVGLIGAGVIRVSGGTP